MSQYQFKTNINCGGCVAKVTPALNALEGLQAWEVDVKDIRKVLKASGTVSSEKIEEAVKKMGFNIEKIA